MNISIKKLSLKLIESFLYFFDEIAFTDNPGWGHCYCVFFHHKGSEHDWLLKTKKDNRETAIRLINENKLRGFLAFEDSKPVGWCSVNEKKSFSFNKNRKNVLSDIDDEIISIVCFLVAPGYRKKGISAMLLNKIIFYYGEKKFRFLEAYPLKDESSDSKNYHGPLSLFIKHGFYIEKEYESCDVVRRKLGEQAIGNGR